MSVDRWTTAVKDSEVLPKLSEVLRLLLNKTKPKYHNDVYAFNRTPFFRKKSYGKISNNLLNESLLNHRFEEAAKLLWIMCQNKTEFNLVLYKGIMVVLENLFSNHEIEIISSFTNDIKHLKLVNKLEIQLDYLIYALKHNLHDLEDLQRKAFKIKGKMLIIPYIQQLYLAYHGLKNYISWVNIKGESTIEDEKEIASSVIACFKDLIDKPGIWDIFILKLVEVLEYYENYKEIEEILKKYVEHNPNHVNAYIYICVHLYKHNTDPNLFIHYAKVLVDMCPSDDRVLLLVEMWNKSGKYLKRRIKILFMFLDYSVNGNKMHGWKLLCLHLKHAASSEKSSTMEAVKSLWNMRCHSWNYMHFHPRNIPSEEAELVSCKVIVVSFLDLSHEYIRDAQTKLSSR